MASNRVKWAGCAGLALILIGGWAALARGASLETVERRISSHGHGDRIYTCLVIDGGVVPLVPPADASVLVGGDVTIFWPKDGAQAVFRPATAAEIDLVKVMDSPDAAAQWKKQLAAALPAAAVPSAESDFQANILMVNHWRAGAISMGYLLGGLECSRLMLLWRTQDGSTITVTLACEAGAFKKHVDEIYSLIGGAMILAPAP